MRLPFRRRPRPMACHEVAEVLQAYLDDETDEVAARRVARHLEDCVRCGLEVVTYRRIKETLGRRKPEIEPGSLDHLRAFGERLAAGRLPGGGDPTGR
jgi:anti-sigma factor RsiW